MQDKPTGTVTTPPSTAGGQETVPCPPWCNGEHHAPVHVTGEQAARYWHKAAVCPPWCTGHLGWQDAPGPDFHAGHVTQMPLSLAPAVDHWAGGGQPDSLSVAIYQASASRPYPVVAVQHLADDYELPDMTPAEAVRLAVALLRAAWQAEPGVTAQTVTDGPQHPAGPCPPWCAYAGDHVAGDEVHRGMGHEVAVAPHDFGGCGDGPDGRGECCQGGVCAELVLGDDGRPLVALHHGCATELPHLVLPAAEELGQVLLGLAAAGMGGDR